MSEVAEEEELRWAPGEAGPRCPGEQASQLPGRGDTGTEWRAEESGGAVGLWPLL